MGLVTTLLSAFQQHRAIVRVVPTWSTSFPKEPDANFENFYKYGYGRNVIVATCIWEIASGACEPRPMLVNRENGEEVSRGPIGREIFDLLEHPNPEQEGDEFLQELHTFQQLTGVWVVRKIRNGAGKVVRLIALDPDHLKIKQDRHGWAVAYKHRYVESLIPADDIIKCKLHANPCDPHWGLSPLKVLGDEVDTDNLSLSFLRSFFKNNAIPAGLLKFKTVVKEEEQAKIQARWEERYSGRTGWNSVAVADASVDYMPIGSDPKSINMSGAWNELATRICMAFQVPPILVGTNVGLMRSTYSNYREARKSFWEETEIPIIKGTASALTRGLVREFDESLALRYDLNSVEALKDQAELRTWAVSAWNASLITRDEALTLSGQTPIGGEKGKEYKSDSSAANTNPGDLPPRPRKPVGADK